MKRPRTDGRPTKPEPHALDSAAVPDSRSIDALYGLEPVFEPGRDDEAARSGEATRSGAAADVPAGGTQFQSVECPYCGESFETLVDLSAGSASYIEDCQICCQPIQFDLEVDHAGRLVTLEARRAD